MRIPYNPELARFPLLYYIKIQAPR